MKDLTFITGNPHKAKQLEYYLKQPVEHQALELSEIQSLDLAEITQHKAQEAFRLIQKPVLVDDASLVITTLGKLPGPFIKYFNEEIGPEKMCQIMQIFPDRTAKAQVMIGFSDGTQVHTFLGEVPGKIAEKPGTTQDTGFGYDFYFIPNGYDHPRSEMSQSDYDQTSPRKQALDQLAKFLNKLPTQ